MDILLCCEDTTSRADRLIIRPSICCVKWEFFMCINTIAEFADNNRTFRSFHDLPSVDDYADRPSPVSFAICDRCAECACDAIG